ncbi:MAG TPA: hypothetical protein VFO97_00805 [Desertimonas sp.]|nr:hypothetical protein [Desertimonas sp.]
MSRTAVRWDWPAMRSGAAISMILALPLAVGARIAADGDHESVAIGFSIGATIGFLVGAGWAAWTQRVGFPLSHGLVTAGGTYLAAQAVFIVIRLLRGEDVRWFAALFTLTFVLLAGLLGGLLGQRLRSAGIQPTRFTVREDP